MDRADFRGIGRKRVLVVDSNVAHQAVIQHSLRLSGLLVDSATMTEDALELAFANRYDLVIVAHFHCPCPGIELIEILRRSGTYAATPIIMLTCESHPTNDLHLRDELVVLALPETSSFVSVAETAWWCLRIMGQATRSTPPTTGPSEAWLRPETPVSHRTGKAPG